MPYWTYGNMSAEDANAIVAYLRTVPGVDDRVPPSRPPFNNVPAPTTRVDLNRLPLPTPTYPFQEQALARRYIDDA